MKMRHAFLIIAHHHWWQLEKLIELLDAENHDIYVHIDKKAEDFSQERYHGIAKYSKVYFYREYAVFWGGFEQVQAEMFLMEKAHEKHYDYYHVISGDDLPLKSSKEIDEFFEKNQGKQFINYDENALKNNPEISRRTRYYHFLQNYRRRYQKQWLNGFFTFLERVSLVIQILFGVNRVKGLDWEIKYGSNWISITDDLVNTILEQKEKIEKVFKYTNCADELFVQTIANHFGYTESVYQQMNGGQTANVRYIDWERGKNGNPYTFRNEDLPSLLENNENLFARKFSEDIDKVVIENVIEFVQSYS